ncbi:replication-relaxation family protein [Streptomyces sp. NPDC101175]|uniref:replication-relaxation family protein n=1 Tax=Streptomyces sp. NPDC101175 TaxID=3366123 RepID=UPI00383722B8
MTTAPTPPVPPTAPTEPAQESAAAAVGPAASPAAGRTPSPAAPGRRLTVVADQTPCRAVPAGCNSAISSINNNQEIASRPHKAAARAGADIRGEVLLALAQLRLAKPVQLKALLLPHQQGTDHVRRALRNLHTDGLAARAHRAQQSYWYCTPAGLAEAAASGEFPLRSGRTTGRRVAAKTGLREHGLALVDSVVAFHRAGAADHTDWRLEVAHPTPAGSLVPDAVVLLWNGQSAFIEIDRTMSYALLIAKLERYDAYRNAPATGRGNAARPPRPHWQETYSAPYSAERCFPPLLFVFAPAPRRAAPATREAAFHQRAQHAPSVGYRITVATTTLARLTQHGPKQPVWRVAGRHATEDRSPLSALPKAR